MESANIGRRNRSTGSIGAGWPRSRRSSSTKAMANTAAAATTYSTGSRCTPSPSAKISAAKVMTLSTAATGSKPCVLRLLSGSERQPMDSASSPIGRFTANSHGQVPNERMTDATVGPTANDTPTISALSPSPRPSRCIGKIAEISAVFTLMMAAAPMPCSARAAASDGSDHAMAQITDEMTKTITPLRYMRR
ncbi:hypothetical protein D3C87_1469540 [compost metagenome]